MLFVTASILLSEEEAVERLVTTILPGTNSSAMAAVIARLPANLKLGSIVTGLATGTLIKSLVGQGRIKVEPDGMILGADSTAPAIA